MLDPIAALTIGSIVSIIALTVGTMLGWIAREYMLTYHENNEDSEEEETYSMHPELMYDEHGNLLTDQLIAFKFDNCEDIEPLDD
mgnify:CR=1 FL=1